MLQWSLQYFFFAKTPIILIMHPRAFLFSRVCLKTWQNSLFINFYFDRKTVKKIHQRHAPHVTWHLAAAVRSWAMAPSPRPSHLRPRLRDSHGWTLNRWGGKSLWPWPWPLVDHNMTMWKHVLIGHIWTVFVWCFFRSLWDFVWLSRDDSRLFENICCSWKLTWIARCFVDRL